MKLFVLGPTQSGKTCLAIGLSGTSYGKTLFRRAFVSNARGDASRNHFKSLQKELAGAHWPAGTTETKTLDFGFQWRGRTVEFSFNDYIGEKSTDPSFLKKLTDLGSSDGVVLLVNPGFTFPCVRDSDGHVRFAKPDEVANEEKPDGYFIAPAFEDSPLAREWLVEQNSIYEQLIESLKTKVGETKNAKPVVAVAVTASDRLEKKGDLRSIRPFFEDFLAKITALLDTAGFKWKRFDVTVTGPLADQSKPKLASGFTNTSPKPFLWILWQLWWRSHQSDLKRAGICAAVVGVLAGLGIGGYEWIESEKDFKTIVTAGSGCSEALRKEPFDKSALEKANKHLESLKQHKGFYSDRAGKSFAELESGVSEKQKELIKRKIRDVNSLNGKWDDKTDKDSPIDEIDSIFSTFVPVSTNLLSGYEDLKNNWNRVKKPKLEEEHDEYVFREKVEMPLRECQNEHGIDVMDKLYPLADVINGRQPKTDRLIDVQTNLAERLDIRVANEWRNFAIRDFEAAASTNATREATRAFVARLEDWNPATTNGTVAKAELFAVATNAVPGWRTLYETNSLATRADSAVRGRDMAELAIYFPDNVATNEFLSADSIQSIWNGGVKTAFEEARKRFGEDLVENIAKRRERPKLTKADADNIQKEVSRVHCLAIFDFATTSNNVQKLVNAKSLDWDAERRNECETWVKENITNRPDRPRTGRDGLIDVYHSEWKNWKDDPNRLDIFFAVVGSAVFRKVEDWLEDDVEFFKSGKSGAEERFAEKFKPLCLRIKEYGMSRDPQSWAYSFAVKCVDAGNIESGFANAFPETFEITQIRGRIVYEGKDIWEYGWAWTQIGFCVQNGDKREVLVRESADKDSANFRKETENGQWKQIWSRSDPYRVTTHAFAPARFAMSAWDWRRLGNTNTHVSWNHPDFSFTLRSFDRNIAGTDGKIQFGGSFGKETEDRTMKAYVLVNLKRISGKTIGEMESEAKKEVGRPR